MNDSALIPLHIQEAAMRTKSFYLGFLCMFAVALMLIYITHGQNYTNVFCYLVFLSSKHIEVLLCTHKTRSLLSKK